MNGTICHKMILLPNGEPMPCLKEKCTAYEPQCEDFAKCKENQKLDRCKFPCEDYCRLLEEY